MAYTAQPTQSAGIFAALQNFFSRVGTAMVMAGESNSRMRRVRALQSMSDAELAKRGIRREDIVRIVFADVLYL